MYVGSRILFALLGIGTVIAVSGFGSLFLMVGVGAFGFFLPRFILKRILRLLSVIAKEATPPSNPLN